MNNTERSLERLDSCNGGFIQEIMIGYRLVKSINTTSQQRPIHTAVEKVRHEMSAPSSWLF